MLADRLLGVAAAFAGGAIIVAGQRIEVAGGDGWLGARAFPSLLGALLLACGLALALRPTSTTLGERARLLLAPRAVAFAAAFLAYSLSFRHLDFRLSSWIFVLAVAWLLGARRWYELALFPAGLTMLVYWMFRYGFNVVLPVWN